MDNQTTSAPDKKSNNAKVVVAIIIIIAALLVGFFLMMGDDVDNKLPETTTEQTQTTPIQANNDTADEQAEQPDSNEQQSQNTITYTDSGFSPATLNIKAGATVTVINSSSKSMQFSSDVHPTHTDHPELNQGVTVPGASTSFTISESGTYGYHDHLNSSRMGTIIAE